MLRRACPDTSWEIINTGVTALNSHAIRLIAAECADYGPDAVLIYMGNNEVVGPYGPGSLLGGDAVPLPLIRAVTWLRSTRTGQALQSAADTVLRGTRPETWSGMDMFQQSRVAQEDPSLERVQRNFEENLRDIVRVLHHRGVPVILSTVASNLTDCPPLGSSPWRPDAALAAYDEGQALLAAGRLPAAAASLRHARDLDELRFRADSGVNAAIREIAEKEQVPLIEAEEDFLQMQLAAPPKAVPLFYEHVHFTFEGNLALASAFTSALADLWGGELPCLKPDFFASITRDDLAMDLGYSPLAEGYSVGAILAMKQKPPFLTQSGNAARVERWNKKLRSIDQALATTGLSEPIRRLEQAAEQCPRDGVLWYWLGRHYEDVGKPDAAIEAYRRSIDALPGNTAVLAHLGDLYRAQLRHAEAVAAYEQFLAIIPSHPDYRRKLNEERLNKQPAAASSDHALQP